MISHASRLAELLVALRAAKWIALDTEADSLHAYPEKLCLVQLGYDGQTVLVDPLAAMTLAPLLEALHGRELVLHGADYDLRLLRRSFGFVPSRVFDTMLAARLAGHRRFGLADLVSHYLGITLEKGPQTANWARRPMTQRMEAYALNDVRYLQPLAERLRAELEQKGRLAWQHQSCARLVEDCAQLRPRDPDRVWRLPGSDRLDRRGLAVLRGLWHWREAEAIRRGRPPYFVLSHETLVALAGASARGHPVGPLLPARFAPAARHQVAATIARDLALPVVEQPDFPRSPRYRPTVEEKQRFAELQKRRDQRAQALDIDPTLIASRAALVVLARDWPANVQELMDWQRELLV
jgi:ribonuclease D